MPSLDWTASPFFPVLPTSRPHLWLGSAPSIPPPSEESMALLSPISLTHPSANYYNPVVVSVCVGAEEFSKSNIAPLTSAWSELSVQLELSTKCPAKSAGISFPICRSSAVVRALYTLSRQSWVPPIPSSHLLTRSTDRLPFEPSPDHTHSPPS
ncbi:hypothetical protein VP01_2910g3 [Puccinia sorghi]|uniref:Uncharacterized protein n=1 Tax=Puccinia sorghi TaxID=27349 RepID=A0A0L6V1D4_9BASI|nr:hypothetical protein VP01_2910g3 [Puccinia sorghi]